MRKIMFLIACLYSSISSAAILNAWDIIGLKPGSTKKEVKAKCRQLMKQYHPDKYKGSPDTFIHIVEACQAIEKGEGATLCFWETKSEVNLKKPTSYYGQSPQEVGRVIVMSMILNAFNKVYKYFYPENEKS